MRCYVSLSVKYGFTRLIFCILCVNVVRLTYTKEEKSCRVEPMCYGSPFLKLLHPVTLGKHAQYHI